MLEPGHKLPPLNLPDQEGVKRKLSDLTGPQGLVLFVYSKDNTSGCSAEAAEFQELLDKFRQKGFAVAGLSKDGAASHAKFAAKLGLTYPLLADEGRKSLAALGAWGEKKLYGKVGMGAIRSTFVSDAKGRLIKVYPKVKAKGHAARLLEDLG
ncbi:hypothetical protein AAU61_02115 [Desulfocarbo indianensis]|nr:hypothetical protein AAU61_02115 [Desulfocarbo indianensis]